MNLLKPYILIFSTFLITACGGGGGGSDAPVTVDTTAPNITSANPSNSSTVSLLPTVSLSFSEDVSGADVLENYSISGTGLGTLTLNSVSYANDIATVSIDGLVANGSIVLSLDNVADLAGNALSAYTLNLSGTTTSPTQSTVPASGSNNLTTLTSLEITYSKDMVNAGNVLNYALTGSAAATLSLDSVSLKAATTSTYVLVFSGTPSDGILNIDISNVVDTVGTPLAGTNISYTFDVTAPQISTTVPANGSLTTTAPTSIIVNYSEAVSGADVLGNYALSGSALGSLVISNVAASSIQVSITLSGTAAEGSLTLTTSNITDPAGNALAGGDAVTLTIDPVAPTRTWDPVDQTVLSSLSSVTVAYSEPVLNADNIASYSLTGNSKGTLAIDSITNTPANSNTYVLNLTGSLLEDNLYKDVSLVSGFPMVTDLAGNNISSQVHWTVDQSAPTLISVQPAENNLAILALSNVRVEFSEAMSADVLDPANYVLSGAGLGTLAVGTPVLVSGNLYDIPLLGTPGLGDISLAITSADIAGNAASEMLSYSFGTPVTIQLGSIDQEASSLASNGAEIIAVGDSNWTLHSTDGGVTWASVAGDQTSGDASYCREGTLGLSEIIYAESKWTTIGGIKGPNGSTILGDYTAACSSSDGSSWSNGIAAGNGDGIDATISDVVFSGIVHNGTDYIAVGRNPDATAAATTQCLHSTSADGLTWPATPEYCLTDTPLKVSTQPNGIHFANGKYFITGSNTLLGPVLSMKADIADRVINWSPVSTSFQRVDKVIHDGTRYLVAGTVGNSASVGYSVDLVNWTYVTAATGTSNMLDIGYDSVGGYLATGTDGVIFTSTDGISWTDQRTFNMPPLRSLLWDATAAHWVVVGGAGYALTIAAP